jgi:hypothetical protein
MLPENLMHVRMLPPDFGILGSQSRCRTPVLKNCDTAAIGQESTFTVHTCRIICSFRFSCVALAERDGTRAETRFRLSLKRTSPFKSVTAGSRGVRISLSNVGYTTFGSGVRVLATHSIRQFPLNFPSRASPCATRLRTSFYCTSSATSSSKRMLKFYYQPLCLCQSCFHTAKFIKFVAAKICFSAGHGWLSCGDEFLRCNHIQYGFFTWGNLCHCKLTLRPTVVAGCVMAASKTSNEPVELITLLYICLCSTKVSNRILGLHSCFLLREY